MAKPNTKEEDTYNCVTIFKESKIYNKVREGHENKFAPSQFLYSEFEIIDVEEGGLIEGGYYEIRNSSNKVVATFTGISEPRTIDGLEPGDYTLKEVIAPDGCYNDKNPSQFTIDSKKDNKEEYKYNVLYIYKERQNSEN